MKLFKQMFRITVDSICIILVYPLIISASYLWRHIQNAWFLGSQFYLSDEQLQELLKKVRSERM